MTKDPIRVFVGCSGNGEDAESMMVLEHSMRKNTDRDVEITWMKPSSDPESFWYCGPGGWQTELWATPFSGFRWGIPAYCNFEGQAIYMDSDMIILSDIGDLWDQEFQQGRAIMAKGGNETWRYCVAKWHCKNAEMHLFPIDRMKAIPESHRRLMSMFANRRDIVQSFEGDWNNVDGEDKNLEDVDILHYSDMSTQPHLKYAIPRLKAMGRKHWFDGNIHNHWRKDVDDLFDFWYHDALNSGYKVEDYVPSDEECFGSYTKESQANYDKYRNKWSK